LALSEKRKSLEDLPDLSRGMREVSKSEQKYLEKSSLAGEECVGLRRK
jgi:hypothetical protein